MNRDALRHKLEHEGIDPRAYELRDDAAPEFVHRVQRLPDGTWSVYYTERGEIFDERRFNSESDACNYIYQELRRVWKPQEPRHESS